jgi:hypothetical protein
MNEPEEFVALIDSFPVKLDDVDAPMLAYLIWSSKVAEYGGTPISSESDLKIDRIDNLATRRSYVRVLGMARRGED